MRSLKPGEADAECAAGESFEVTLGVPVGAGYEWMIEIGGEPGVVSLVSREVVRPKAGGGRGVGGSATERFEFLAERAGLAEVGFELRRPWEQSEGKSSLLRVRVG
jgi:predicted secreted protein